MIIKDGQFLKCKNGEFVLVKSVLGDDIYIEYKEEVYGQSIACIGKTLFVIEKDGQVVISQKPAYEQNPTRSAGIASTPLPVKRPTDETPRQQSQSSKPYLQENLSKPAPKPAQPPVTVKPHTGSSPTPPAQKNKIIPSKKSLETNHVQGETRCPNCKEYRSGECKGYLRFCRDYMPCLNVSQEVIDRWPKQGDATRYRQQHPQKR